MTDLPSTPPLSWTREPSRVVRISDGVATYSSEIPEGLELDRAVEDFLSTRDYSNPDLEEVPEYLELNCWFQVNGEVLDEFSYSVDLPVKEDVPLDGWTTVARYLALVWDGEQNVAVDREVQVGTPGGPLRPWYVRSFDPEEDEGEVDEASDLAYPSRVAAIQAALTLAKNLHQGEPRETADEYNRRVAVEAVKADPEGTWCLYWTAPDGQPGSGPSVRYATRELAENALSIAQGDPVSLPGFRGINPLDEFEVRQLVDGKWVK
jgi:hypothetical protein